MKHSKVTVTKVSGSSAPVENRKDQTKRVYEWEDTWEGVARNRLISLNEAEVLSGVICGSYGIYPPNVYDGRGCRDALGSARSIHLPRSMRCLMVLLHELSHAIVAYYNEPDDHGPMFVRTCISLYHEYLGISERVMERKAREMRVLFAPKSSCLPPTSTKIRELKSKIKSLAKMEETMKKIHEKHLKAYQEYLQVHSNFNVMKSRVDDFRLTVHHDVWA